MQRKLFALIAICLAVASCQNVSNATQAAGNVSSAAAGNVSNLTQAGNVSNVSAAAGNVSNLTAAAPSNVSGVLDYNQIVNGPRQGMCILVPESDPSIAGYISFQQLNNQSETKLYTNITGLKGNDFRFDLHQWGDYFGGCKNMGPAFNLSLIPQNLQNLGQFGGANASNNQNDYMIPDDFWKLKMNNGVVTEEKTSRGLKMWGDWSIMGRGMSISLVGGNVSANASANATSGGMRFLQQNATQSQNISSQAQAQPPIACCVIGFSNVYRGPQAGNLTQAGNATQAAGNQTMAAGNQTLGNVTQAGNASNATGGTR